MSEQMPVEGGVSVEARIQKYEEVVRQAEADLETARENAKEEATVILRKLESFTTDSPDNRITYEDATHQFSLMMRIRGKVEIAEKAVSKAKYALRFFRIDPTRTEAEVDEASTYMQ